MKVKSLLELDLLNLYLGKCAIELLREMCHGGKGELWTLTLNEGRENHFLSIFPKS